MRAHGSLFSGYNVRVKRLVLIACLALASAGCASSSAGPAAPKRVAAAVGCPPKALAGWKRLANRIKAPVYCPAWMADPLDGVIGARWNNLDFVDPDRSYLEGFVWQEVGSGELHVNLRGYPGRTAIPRCIDADSKRRRKIPCFSDAHGTVKANGIVATVYTVNQDADQWHVLYAWRRGGSLYTLSEHVALPLDYTKVRRYLDRMLGSLVLVRPAS